MQVKFEYDNRDRVLVTDAETPSEAVNAAVEFLREIEENDEEYMYCIDEEAYQNMEQSESNSYSFRVIQDKK